MKSSNIKPDYYVCLNMLSVFKEYGDVRYMEEIFHRLTEEYEGQLDFLCYTSLLSVHAKNSTTHRNEFNKVYDFMVSKFGETRSMKIFWQIRMGMREI
eukprot:UN02328